MNSKDLFRVMEAKNQLRVIGAHDGLTGRLGEEAGFDAVWASGLEIATSHGVPDANILDMSHQLRASCVIDEAVSIPVIADCDNGYGNGVNAEHMAKRFFRAGISGVCIEDNVFPKRNSFMGGVRRELVPAQEHALKVRACKEATGGGLFVIARTEALIAGYSMEEALDRAEAYAEAGADAVLVHSKEKTPGQVREFANRWPRPTPLVAVPTTYDSISADELGRLGYRIVIFANQGMRAAVKAIRSVYRRLQADGCACGIAGEIATVVDLFGLANVNGLQESERKYLPAGDNPTPAPIQETEEPSHAR